MSRSTKEVNREEETLEISKNVDEASFFDSIDKRNDVLPIRWIRYHDLQDQENVPSWGVTEHGDENERTWEEKAKSNFKGGKATNYFGNIRHADSEKESGREIR